jgi:hypothetical protein
MLFATFSSHFLPLKLYFPPLPSAFPLPFSYLPPPRLFSSFLVFSLHSTYCFSSFLTHSLLCQYSTYIYSDLFTPVAFFHPSYMERISSLHKTFSLSSPSLLLPFFTYYQKSEIRIHKPEHERTYKTGNLLRTAKTL